MAASPVLHYLGYDDDRGGIVAVIRALAATGLFPCVLGVNPNFEQRQSPPLTVLELPSIAGERLDLRTLWRACVVARRVQAWLRADSGRVLHAHSRAGLVVALWLRAFGERRVVVSVHCYGRRRWFYRWAARQMDSRLFWLSPAMRAYYGAPGAGWSQCVPGGVPGDYMKLTAAEPNPERLRLGGAGALVRWKRWDLLLDALALLPPAVRDRISFEHIGAAPAEPEAQAFASELRQRPAGHVTWKGAEPSSRRLLQSIDVFVTLSHQEPFSMAMQEALAAGIPVLAANSGGAADLIVPGRNGWLFRDGNTRELAQNLEELVQTRAWATLDRDRIRRSAHLAPAVAAQWKDIYARL
jgi:glycosyltransferase involved in cell wall biosynthesis